LDLDDLYRLLRTTHVQAQAVVDTVREPLLVLDRELTVLSASRSFYETFGVGRDETLGRHLYELGDGQWDIPDLRHLLEAVIPRSAAVEGYEVEHDFPGLGRRAVLLHARRLSAPTTTAPRSCSRSRTSPSGAGGSASASCATASCATG
jgi:PAS domain-containing protein